ncbi:phage holin family protein [Couchioplanes caeruleus]|uniref:phage holin family protein n=1 Tax=Couchioplanes caeruleus TaxID=56438 RepID=UPI0020BEA497|nr:phage holin family protein [Couchioplanes caeruleus]UQU64079.1 phage holin family protein [Couchioplanes caeruleus]
MRPHRTDGISLSFGLIFLLVAAWWAVAQVVTVRLPALGWLVAGVLILFGALGLLGAIRSGRRTEVPAPVAAEAEVEVPGDLPPEMHADIVRELLDNPAEQVDLPPAPPAAAERPDGSRHHGQPRHHGHQD